MGGEARMRSAAAIVSNSVKGTGDGGLSGGVASGGLGTACKGNKNYANNVCIGSSCHTKVPERSVDRCVECCREKAGRQIAWKDPSEWATV
jgi:hypothetical protein